MAWLTGDVSEPSNETGYAVFKNLTILGSNSKFVYIYFTCDGVTVTPWAMQKAKTYQIYSLPYYIPPIKVISVVNEVQIRR